MIDPAVVRENFDFYYGKDQAFKITLKTGVKIVISDWSKDVLVEFTEDSKGNVLNKIPEGYRFIDSKGKLLTNFWNNNIYRVNIEEDYVLIDTDGDVLLKLNAPKAYNIVAPGCIESDILDD